MCLGPRTGRQAAPPAHPPLDTVLDACVGCVVSCAVGGVVCVHALQKIIQRSPFEFGRQRDLLPPSLVPSILTLTHIHNPYTGRRSFYIKRCQPWPLARLLPRSGSQLQHSGPNPLLRQGQRRPPPHLLLLHLVLLHFAAHPQPQQQQLLQLLQSLGRNGMLSMSSPPTSRKMRRRRRRPRPVGGMGGKEGAAVLKGNKTASWCKSTSLSCNKRAIRRRRTRRGRRKFPIPSLPPMKCFGPAVPTVASLSHSQPSMSLLPCSSCLCKLYGHCTHACFPSIPPPPLLHHQQHHLLLTKVL